MNKLNISSDRRTINSTNICWEETPTITRFPVFYTYIEHTLLHFQLHYEDAIMGTHDGVSNHQPHDCLLKRLIRRRWMKISKLSVTGLFAGNSPVTGEFPAQRASNAKNVSIWWRHHVKSTSGLIHLHFPLTPLGMVVLVQNRATSKSIICKRQNR